MTLIGAKVFAEESRAYEARKRIVDSANSIIEALPAVASVRVYRVDDLDGKPRFSSDVTFAKVDRPWCAEELALIVSGLKAVDSIAQSFGPFAMTTDETIVVTRYGVNVETP